MSRWLIPVFAAAWGFAWVTARYAAGGAPSEWMAVGRFVFASLALLLVANKFGGLHIHHNAKTWTTLVGMGLTGAIGYNVLFLRAIEEAPASDGAIIAPAVAGAAGLLFLAGFGFRPTVRQLQGAALSIVGIAVVGWAVADFDAARIAGDLLFALAGLIWGVYTALSRIANVKPFEGVFWTVVIGSAIWFPMAWYLVPPEPAAWTLAAWGNMVYLGLVGTAIGFVAYNLAVRELGMGRVAPGMGLVPVFGVLAAVLFLGERLQWQHAVGAALVVLGIMRSAPAKVAAPAPGAAAT